MQEIENNAPTTEHVESVSKDEQDHELLTAESRSTVFFRSSSDGWETGPFSHDLR